MSHFYARYVPPAKKTVTTTGAEAQLNGSTKRKLPEQDLALREPKKARSVGEAELKKDGFGVKRFVPKEKKPNNPRGDNSLPETAPPQSQSKQPSSGGRDVLEKYTVTGAAKKNNNEADVLLHKAVQKGTASQEEQAVQEPTKASKTRKTKKNRSGKHDEAKKEAEEAEKDPQPVNTTWDAEDKFAKDGFEKHAAVRDRFRRAKTKSEQHQDYQQKEDVQDIPRSELHGLEPLPQPPELEQPYEAPTYSTLPAWLAKADHISQDTTVDFASLGLSNTLLANLNGKRLEKAMPIQSAVIPLLSSGPVKHDGDLAVAAATGSGKTLAYLLPMVEALKDLSVTKLRGIVVVPTRELVKQVQETLNMCAEGTSLRVGTALGSKSVKEEADALVESYEVYDAETYAEQQSKIVDWAEFSVIELFDRVTDAANQAPNHVTKHRSKVDVLVCTPGRLVEHLQTTKGFTLDDVQWLVIDEVDRLLNESYQEWLEFVMPALQSRGATKLRDEVLQHMGMNLPPRIITKVILSATMTQDLSKLNALNLRNPKILTLEGEQVERPDKLIIAQEEDAEPTQDASGAFQLPSTLTETAVLVGDGSDKPLHLLELLQARIGGTAKPVINGAAAHKLETSDSESSSSDSSDATSSSDSDSPAPIPTYGIKSSSPLSTKYPPTLIFTRSTSSAPRLSRLLSLLSPTLTSQIAVLTRSTTSSASSRRALKSFRAGTVPILITTDRAARGLDIPNIEHVVNYDVPTSVQFYVHRVGRTARAGKNGKAWTLLAHREGRWFDREIGRGEMVRRKRKVAKINLEGVGKEEGMRSRYEEALRRLGEEVEGKES